MPLIVAFLAENMAMNTWKKITFVNMGGLLGIGISLFTVPPKTPLWIWATASVVWLAVVNYLLILRLRKGNGARKISSAPSIVIWLGVVAMLLELVFRYWHR
jgi:hypothetical protein